MQKKLIDISSIEWAMNEWHNVTATGDGSPVYVKGRLRTPEEAVKAKKDFEEWIQIAKVYDLNTNRGTL